MAQSKLDLPNDLVSSKSSGHSCTSEGEASGGSDEEKVAVGLHDESKDHFALDDSNPSESNMDGMENLIYVHVIRLGESLLEEPDDYQSGYKDATNDWYVIKQGSDGGVEISRVFEDIKHLNYPYHALEETTCQVIGSCIYVIGGRSVYTRISNGHVIDPGSSKIRCLDTHNPKDGWRTCFTLPFTVCRAESAVVDDQWLYLFGGYRHKGHVSPDFWVFALNVDDNSKEQVRKITKPGSSTFFPVVSTLSQGTLVVYMEQEGILHHLDCTNSTWSVYKKDLPYRPSRFPGCTTVSDGIFYIYDTANMRLISYDIHNKKELPQVDLPRSFWFGHEEMVNLIVLAKNKFCLVWDAYGDSFNYIYIYYTRFSVSYDLPKPTVSIEEKQFFYIGGCKILNVVAMDRRSDVMTNGMSCNREIGNCGVVEKTPDETV